ncbi:hypothetical protein [Streptomyces erythrochromogenes]|uniref:hypothetical protein n=1 Tax=Streptomyces erythrochromogenes TaxID=285574 RepID=UPI0037D2A317
MDKNPGPSTATPKEAGLAAVFAVITGKMSMEDLGYRRRAMNPTGVANPIAPLAP